MASDVSWASDIAPIFETHCSDASCHGAATEDTVPLTTYDDWFERALEIQNNVLTGRMPRERKPSWSSTEIATILDWIEGGMQP